MLAVYQANYGDWRKLFSEIDDLNKVTAADLQRVMIKYFVPTGRTSAYTAVPGQAAPPAAGVKQ